MELLQPQSYQIIFKYYAATLTVFYIHGNRISNRPLHRRNFTIFLKENKANSMPSKF